MMPSRFPVPDRRAGALPPAALVLAACLLAAPVRAQLSQGGRGGGLPGGGGTGGGPTGGAPLVGDELAYHLLDRITYGHTPADLDLLRQLGFEGYLRRQLDPDGLAESAELTARLAALPPVYTPVGDPAWDWPSLYADYLLRARYTTRQLNEVMTEFWQNHFDTGLDIGNGGAVGFFSSLAFDPATGFPAIAYYDAQSAYPRWAWWNGSAWTQQTIEFGRGSGLFTSFTYDTSVTPAAPSVSYYDGRNGGRLRFARFNGTAWQASTVEDPATGNVGAWTSLEVTPSGTRYIAYQDLANLDLKLATWNGTAWTTQVVDAAGDVGSYASLALTAGGLPAVAYFDATQGDLKYAEWDGSAWAIEVVDGTGRVGSWCSLAVSPATGRPAIAYYDEDNQDLRYAELEAAPRRWTLTTVDATGSVGDHAALAFDPAGEPAIAYRALDGYDLKLARRAAGSWQAPETVSEVAANMAGEWSSLAFVPATGQPAISFYNGSIFALRYAERTATAWLLRSAEARGTSRFLYTVWERDETEGFRQNALGRFRDLLDVSAKGPAMMLFLNNNENTATNGNENYARELLELHTLGVDGGYGQIDVETTARAFTGWTISPSSTRCDVRIPNGSTRDFCYNHRAHDGSAKTIVGVDFADDSANVAANWMKQGNEILDMLARHPSTAKFVCGKLLQKFVADAPPSELLGRCVATFLASDGDVKRVLETILLSPEFRASLHSGNKVRTPFEYTIAPVRHLDGDTDGASLYATITSQGMPLFRNTVPTGYPEAGTDWVNSNGLLQRWKYADALLHSGAGTVVDPYAIALASGVTTAEGVVELFVARLLRGHAGATERALLVDCLAGPDPSTFAIGDRATVEPRLRDTVGILLGFAEYQKQ